MYAASTRNVDTWIKMSSGSHLVVVQNWDSTGKVTKSPVNITVR